MDRGEDQAWAHRPDRRHHGGSDLSCLRCVRTGNRDRAHGRRGVDNRLMANEKVTSVDVARLAGVSQSAVSRYFTPGTSVSTKTGEKIKAAADQLGYRPNVLARSLITGRSRIIGLVVAYLENYFYPEV